MLYVVTVFLTRTINSVKSGLNFSRTSNKNITINNNKGEIHLKPIVSEYFNEEKLVQDINQLISKGIEKDKIYVISHDQDRTKRIAEKADSNTIGLQEMVIDDLVGTFFESKGDELRTKMKEIVLSEREAKTL